MDLKKKMLALINQANRKMLKPKTFIIGLITLFYYFILISLLFLNFFQIKVIAKVQMRFGNYLTKMITLNVRNQVEVQEDPVEE